MTKTIPELQEELGREQVAALSDIFDSHRAHIDLVLDPQVQETLTPVQKSRLVAQQKEELIREAVEEAKQTFFSAEEAYALRQEERIEEIREQLFGEAADLSPSEMKELVTADEETLLDMLEMCQETGNRRVAVGILHVAHQRELAEVIIRYVEGDPEAGNLLEELTLAWSDEELEARMEADRFFRIAPASPAVEDLMQPRVSAYG